MRIAKPFPMKRKHFELSVNTVEKLQELQKLLGHGSEAETLRYCISQTFHIEKSMKEEGITLKFVDTEGKERGVVFF